MTGNLHILHAISSDRFAGVEQFVRRLAIRQSLDGHAVTVIGGAAEQMAQPLRAAGVGWTAASTTRAVYAAARARLAASDVVNTHMTAADLATLAARRAESAGTPIVSTRHFAQRRGSRGPGAAYRAVEQRIDAEISISRAVADRIGVASTIIHPGVDPVPLPSGSAARRDTVLVAQRLQPEKHTDLAVRAFAVSGIADEGWTLEIAGAGPERDELARLADGLGVGPSVRFLGFRSDLPQLMAEAGMLFASSPFEHFGLTVLEAMAAGLPVVAADAAGHAEMLDGIDARTLFSPGDVTAAAAGLRELAHDEPGRARIGTAERERQARVFSLRAQADATESVYRAVIGAREAAA